VVNHRNASSNLAMNICIRLLVSAKRIYTCVGYDSNRVTLITGYVGNLLY